MKTFWDDARVERLRFLAAPEKIGAKLSAREISFQLNREFGGGCSRNAVIGKLARMGIPLPIKKVISLKPRAVIPRLKPDVKITAPKTNPVSFISKNNAFEPIPGTSPIFVGQLEIHHCRWPVGDNPVMYCGETKKPDSWCCPAHHNLAYIPGSGRHLGAKARVR